MNNYHCKINILSGPEDRQSEYIDLHYLFDLSISFPKNLIFVLEVNDYFYK